MKLTISSLLLTLAISVAAQEVNRFDYRVLATSRTSTMEKEMNQAAESGFVFGGVMGGESAAGGKEVLVVMKKSLGDPGAQEERNLYKLLATSKTSTMEKELQRAGEDGFEFRGATVFESAVGGREVALIMEKRAGAATRTEYKLLATSKTGTMQKELREAGDSGFRFLAVVLGKTAFGGSEVLSVLSRPAR